MRKPYLLTALPLGFILISGCRQNKVVPPPTDQQITEAINAKLAADQSLQGQDVTPAVSNGIATLTGTSTDEASREQAGADAGSIAGVKTVINDVTIPSAQTAACAPSKPVKLHRVHVRHAAAQRAPIERAEMPTSRLPPPPPPMRPPAYVYVAPPPPVVLVPRGPGYWRYRRW